jgi:hypothetical protein
MAQKAFPSRTLALICGSVVAMGICAGLIAVGLGF